MQYIKNLKARKIDRSLLYGESFELFSAALRSSATRDSYERKFLGFLKRANQSPEQFAQFAKEILWLQKRTKREKIFFPYYSSFGTETFAAGL